MPKIVNPKRADLIKEMKKNGSTVQELSGLFNLTRQRIYQILEAVEN